jgi:hypothetical protein
MYALCDDKDPQLHLLAVNLHTLGFPVEPLVYSCRQARVWTKNVKDGQEQSNPSVEAMAAAV